MKFLLLTFLMLFAGSILACSEDGSSGIVEENDLYIPADLKHRSGVTQEQFNEVIAKIETIYAPIVSGMGGNLKVQRKWTDGTVNANASRSGSVWNVNMYGGLARHETITPDGFALVLCHEIGHHLGGAPKVSNFMQQWASNEGQSDYFAALKCLRKAFLNDDNSSIISNMSVPEILTNTCAKNHPNKDDQAICIRTGMAGVSVSNLFAAIKKQPAAKFETPDRNVVTATNHAHPAHQCRLDTFFQGSLCDVSFNDDVSQKDATVGTCNQSTGHTTGLRPLCWYKPRN